MVRKFLPYDEKLALSLKGVPWKEINQKFKNDFSKTEKYLYSLAERPKLEFFAKKMLDIFEKLELAKPLKPSLPPTGWRQSVLTTVGSLDNLLLSNRRELLPKEKYRYDRFNR